MLSASTRRLLPALAAVILATPVSGAVVAAPAHATGSLTAARQTTGPALMRLATLPDTTSAITSPKDGTAYVAGVDADGQVKLERVVRRANGSVTTTTIAVPSASGYTRVSLTSGGGRTYLLVASLGATTVYEVVGARVVPQTLPDAGPVAGTRIVHAIAAADDGTPWVVLGVPVAPGAPVQDYYAAHRDRHGSWTFTTTFHGSIINVKRAFVSAGRIVVVGGTQGLETRSITWEGATWRDERVGFQKFQSNVLHDETTTVSATDYTRWGFNLEQPQPPASGAQFGVCLHVVDGQSASCPAPRWAVTAAVRLADGRVVLGGEDAISQMWGRAAQGGVAVVATPNAEPTEVEGEVGSGVIDLAAANRGTTVWALTSDRSAEGTRSGVGLQVLHLPKASPATKAQPKKKH